MAHEDWDDYRDIALEHEDRPGRRLVRARHPPARRHGDPYGSVFSRSLHERRNREPSGYAGQGEDVHSRGHGVFGGRRGGGRLDMRGRGPRGYVRSDDRLWEAVCDALTEASDLDASDIEVAVDRGEVTLAGTVGERADRRLAEDLAGAVTGVRHVRNDLRIGYQRLQELS